MTVYAWLLLGMALAVGGLVAVSSGCCASTCEAMLVECERGLEDLHAQLEAMCSCGLPESESDDDGGCALAAAEAP